jgi:hypothetical protein
MRNYKNILLILTFVLSLAFIGGNALFNSSQVKEVKAQNCKVYPANCDNASDHSCCSGYSCQDGQGGWKCRTEVVATSTPTPFVCTTTGNSCSHDWQCCSNDCHSNHCRTTATPTVTPTPTPFICATAGNHCSHDWQCCSNDCDSGNCHNLPTATLTPTPTPCAHHNACREQACVRVEGVGEDSCKGDKDCEVELSVTPTVEPTAAPTEAPAQSATNVGGLGDGLSDGRNDGRSDGRSSSPQVGGQVLGASTGPMKAVLGLSTTSGENELIKLAQILGSFALSMLGLAFYKKSA